MEIAPYLVIDSSLEHSWERESSGDSSSFTVYSVKGEWLPLRFPHVFKQQVFDALFSGCFSLSSLFSSPSFFLFLQVLFFTSANLFIFSLSVPRASR